MSSLNIGQPPPDAKGQSAWIVQALFKIQQFLNATDVATITDSFTTTGTVTQTRTFDAAAGTTDDVRNVLATLIRDLHARGSKQV